MLIVSLIPAAILLAAAHRAARPEPHPVQWGTFLGWGFVAAVFPCGMFVASPTVLGLWALLGIGLLVWQLTSPRGRSFLPYSAAAVLIAYGLAAPTAWRDYTRFAELRGRYPFESMAVRVPEPRRGDATLTPAAEKALELFEGGPGAPTLQRFRELELRYLHEYTVQAFINSPGFGVTRMRPPPREESLKPPPDRPEPPPQPASPGPAWDGAGFMGSVSADQRADFGRMHTAGLFDFVNPGGWGYARSRREVAGFLPHAFSRVPEASEWKVERVELVGLLRHADPVVYQSERLPAMADVKDAPTRSLDAFEIAGLKAIRRGEDGFAGRRGDEVRFVGAVRSANACVGCHGGERGDLLGAFSYRLRPAAR
ncbi:hypothetical protein J0H58_09550 [bacterium]|nr:hypothetical protein [bacterium]